MDILRETNFDFLGEKKTGKVRDIYLQPARIVLVTTDRHSSFDRIIAHIPHKGQVLNQISAYWMKHLESVVPNHVLAIPDPNATVAKKCQPIAVEAVVRGYLTGVTGTSIWTRYQNGERTFGSMTLPDGMRKNQMLPTPVFDPTTKEDTHDRALTPDQMIQEGFITKERFELLRATALKLFGKGQELARSRGLILVDTKYEFGIDENGVLTLIDEIHTPDSSRYWQLESYDLRFARGEEPEYFDKEFLRLWFKEHCDPYNDPVLPEAPQELVEEMSRRYIRMYEQITGDRFVPAEQPIIPRMEKNLKPYAA